MFMHFLKVEFSFLPMPTNTFLNLFEAKKNSNCSPPMWTHLNLLAGSLPRGGLGGLEERPGPVLLVLGRRGKEVHVLLGDAASATLHLAQRPVLPLRPEMKRIRHKEVYSAEEGRNFLCSKEKIEGFQGVLIL
jgi:hypothetical protein